MECEEQGGTGSMYEDHQDITEYDLVVLAINMDKMKAEKAARDAKTKKAPGSFMYRFFMYFCLLCHPSVYMFLYCK
jgi:hypothetical protein